MTKTFGMANDAACAWVTACYFYSIILRLNVQSGTSTSNFSLTLRDRYY